MSDTASNGADSVEQSRQVESRQIKQSSSGTASIKATSGITRTAVHIKAPSGGKARIATMTEAICDRSTRVAVNEATTIQTQISERVQFAKRESRWSTEIDGCARVATEKSRGVARIAGDRITRTAQFRSAPSGCEQISQPIAQSKAGQATADWVARTACNHITGATGANRLTRIAVIDDTNAIDQSLQTGEQVAASYNLSVARGTARVNARRVPGTCIPLNAQH